MPTLISTTRLYWVHIHTTTYLFTKLIFATPCNLHGYCSHDWAKLSSSPRKIRNQSSFPMQKDILPPAPQVANETMSQPWPRPKHTHTVPAIVIRLPNHNPSQTQQMRVAKLTKHSSSLCLQHFVWLVAWRATGLGLHYPADDRTTLLWSVRSYTPSD